MTAAYFGYITNFLIRNVLIILIGMLGVYVLTGLTGMFSMGQASFMAVGGYTTAILTKYYQLPFYVTLPAAVLVGALVGFLIGIPAVRLRKDYVAIVSLGFGEALVAFLDNASSVTGGALGLTAIPRYIEKWMIIAALVLVIAFIWNFKKSRFGRQCLAVKADELAAASMGIHVARIKLVVFTLAGSISALAGYLYVHTLGYLDSASFGWTQSSMWIIIVFFGGINSLTGAIFAGILLNLIPEVFRFSNEMRVIIYCLVVLFIVNFRPQGLFGDVELDLPTLRKIGRRLARPVAGLLGRPKAGGAEHAD
ncbi:MAG TPA: branched-chain amino acid ABC transporter permease [Candidatus Limnocylindria bacterium]|nr:branched-chain amino acid ABC transporter permease [Candidatus Limnocylindria bacterium]